MSVFLFSLDTVLAHVDTDAIGNPVYTNQPCQGAEALVAAAKATGWDVGIVSNQAGPAWKMMTGGEQFPGVNPVCRRLILIARATGTTDCTWFLSTWDEAIWDHLSCESEEEWLALNERRETNMPRINERFIENFERFGLVTPGVSSSPEWRLPGTKMLEDIMMAAKVSPEDVVMVAPEKSREAKAAQSLGIVSLTVVEAQELLHAYMEDAA